MIKHLMDVISKILVLPFSEPIFLERDYFQELIDICSKPETENQKYDIYKEMQESVQESLKETYHIINLDRINLLIEQYFPLKCFKNHHMSSDIYLDHLNRLSRTFIAQRNGNMVLKYWENENDKTLIGGFNGISKVEIYNAFARQFCMDLLVVNYILDNGMNDVYYLNGYYWLISVGDLQLDQILDKGIAENHIHINAGITFHRQWQGFVDISHCYFEDDGLKSGLQKIFKSELDKKRMSVLSVIRMWMCNYLVDMRDRGDVISSFDYLIKQRDSEERYSSDFTYRQLEEIIRTFINGKMIPLSNIGFTNIYNKIRRKESLKDLFQVYIDTTEENLFLFYALNHIRHTGDKLFSKLFWQYICFKNIIYQRVTQNNCIQGLDYFEGYFSKATLSVGNEDDITYLEQRLKEQIYNNNLEKLEIRFGVGGRGEIEIKRNVNNKVKWFLNTYKKILIDLEYNPHLINRMPEIGLVFHLIKTKDNAFYEKCWCFADNVVEKEKYFYGELQKQYTTMAKVIKELRQTVKGLSYYVVGIDAASKENNVEPWVFAPVYKNARDSKDKRYLMTPDKMPEMIHNLGYTFHVGEEFRHIISGLRHIDEVINHFDYHVGDRIGHGIALGIDVEEWWHENSGICILPRIEYLEDLLWIWGLTYYNVIEFKEFETCNLEKEILTHAKAIYHNMNGITVFNLWLAYQKKFMKKPFKANPEFMHMICPEEAERDGNSSRVDGVLCAKSKEVHRIIWDEEKLLHAYHCRCYLERMYEVIQVNIDKSEIQFLKHLQQVVISRLDDKGIVVETNPTSNLAISGINRLFNLHSTRLNTINISEKNKTSGLIITINSDDPSVFNTSTSNELAYIFYALQDQGYPRDLILEWIDKIRSWGIDTSFIKTRKIGVEDRIKEIDAIINALS